MNVMFGFDETDGLKYTPLTPVWLLLKLVVV
jgi:hypothetical protein